MAGPTMIELQQAQGEFERQYAARPGVVGVGIGLNVAHTAPALNVYVTSPDVFTLLPKSLNGVEVVYDVVGEVRPFAAG